MAEKRIVVPEEMLKAVDEAIGKARREKSARPGVIGGDAELWPNEIKNISIKAALRWQTENPPVPTRKQIEKMAETHRNDPILWNRFGSSSNPAFVCSEWVRRMYDEPETEGCPVYKALLDSGVTISNDWLCPECQRVHEAILNDKKPEVPEIDNLPKRVMKDLL